MKTYIQYVVFVGLVAFGCKKDGIPAEAPECVKAIINDIQSQGKWNPPAKVLSYTYKGQTVYFIPQRCCDIPSILMDDRCNIICAPDGGIAGGGDGKCKDFFKERTNENLIWKDTR